MSTKDKPAVRRPLFFICAGIMAVLMACSPGSAVTGTSVPTQAPSAALRLEHGAVEVQNENDAWVPVAGESTFELVGVLESTDPWMVTGNTFATRESTRIAEGLEVGDVVRVKGVILEDVTWLASSIEPVDEQPDAIILLTGRVDSINPWVVSGIPLEVTEDTVITGEISPEMMVRVEILLAEDGTWEVLGITPLEDVSDIPGCALVRATVENVNGNEITFAGWPAVITLGEEVKIEDEEGVQSTLSPGQTVLVVVCPTQEGQFVITRIVVLNDSPEEPSGNTGKVLICHKPGKKKGGHTLSVAEPAVPAHIGHGDTLGPCP